MRKSLAFVVFTLVVSILACNSPQPGTVPPPTDTPPKDTPPITEPATVGVLATETPPTVSITVEPPTSTPQAEETPLTVVPTDTPMVVCTPPLCKEDEVYYCPGDCPGGCGTQCATPTAAPLPLPQILSFTADPTTIVQGESVTLAWQATDGTEASICWVTYEAIMTCLPDPIDPDAGTQTIKPTGPGRPGKPNIVLKVKNNVGSAEAQVDVTIECAEEPLPELADKVLYGNCPYGTVVGNAAYQPFERGYMIWLEGDRSIYVLYADGRYEMHTDNFQDGDPESDPTIVPPEDLVQPVRGFGLLWRTNQDVREGLGWAVAPEQGFQGWSQSFTATGMHNSGTFIRFIDGSICHLSHFGAMWDFVTP